jgi:hypothetical protein
MREYSRKCEIVKEKQVKSVKYIDQVLKERSFKNDFALSKHLGWSSGAISMYRTGKRIMDDEACLALAMELGINPLEIIGAAGMDRAEKTGQKSLWEVFMSRTAAPVTSALLIGFVTLFLTTPTPSEAKTMQNASEYKLCEGPVVLKVLRHISHFCKNTAT